MESMLSELEYIDGNYEDAIERAYRALALINKESMVSI